MLSRRTNVILLLSSLVLYPLCSLKSLNSLAPFSLLGLGGYPCPHTPLPP